ncbi:hypothetical protein [Nocardia sp. NPDC004123]
MTTSPSIVIIGTGFGGLGMPGASPATGRAPSPDTAARPVA